MSRTEGEDEITPEQLRQRQIRNYWAADLSRRVFLMRRQRKAILDNCRRIVVVGASSDPNSRSYLTIEKLLGLGLEIIPIFTDRESFLGLRCFRTLRDVPGKIDIVQIYPQRRDRFRRAGAGSGGKRRDNVLDRARTRGLTRSRGYSGEGARSVARV